METTTPPAAVPAPAPSPVPAWPKPPRSLPAGRGASWWTEGWKIFTVAPLPWVGMIVVLFVINVVLNLVPVIGGLAGTVLGPVFAGGLLLGCHALAQGRPLEFMHLFAAFQSDRLGPLAILGLIVLAFGIVVMLAVGALVFGAGATAFVAAAIGQSGDAGMGSAMAGMGAAAVIGALVALVAGAVFAMAWWFAPALVTLNRAAPLDALQASFRAALANLGALLVFGLIFVALAVAATIPMGLGWLVLGPVAVGAAYASWREVFGD